MFRYETLTTSTSVRLA